MYYSIHTYQSTESTKITEDVRFPSKKWNTMYILASSHQYYFLQFLDILRLRRKYNNISVNASLIRGERERERPAEREGARREVGELPSLTGT